MTTALKDRGITVTIKYGKGYEETWAVFNGQVDEVRADLIAYFGVAESAVSDQTLSELVVNVTSLAHGKGNAASYLGAVVLGEADAKASTEEAQQGTGTADDVWAAAAQGALDEPEVSTIFGKIESCTDVDSLRLLWVENQPSFANADVMEAWKARGRALAAAA